MNMTLKHKQRGFTLLELVIVIVIIGILAAIAIPKFTSLSRDARIGVMNGIAGALSSANVTVYSASQIQGKGTGSTPGTPLVCTAAGISATFGYATNMAALKDCVTLSSDLAVAGETIQHQNASTPAQCIVTYGAPANSAASPTYVLTTSGC